MKRLSDAQQEKHNVYYLYECEHCHEQLVITGNELQLVRFNPIKYKSPVDVCTQMPDGTLRWHTKMETAYRSSDPSKDVFEFKCCHCGHVNKVSTTDYWDHHCNSDGSHNIVIELTEEQSAEARKFMNDQQAKHEAMKIKMDPMGITYKYTIIPGSLGDSIIIEDLRTHDTIDLTHVDKW